MPAIGLLGSRSNHGGTIITCSETTTADGIGVCREGDLHSCPIPGHGITPMVTCSPTTSVDGHAVATLGSQARCGAALTTGSPTVSAD